MLRTDLIRKSNRASATQGSQNSRPTIIGLYGISGSGKSYFMNELKNQPETNEALFFEGSEALDRVVPGGLEAFRGLNRDQKYQYRQEAVRSIKQTCEGKKSMGIVTGHYMLHPYAKTPIQTVGTEADFQTFTHIFYLRVDPEQVLKQRRDDTKHFDSATPQLRAPLPPSAPDATPGSALTNTDEVLPVVNIIGSTFLKRAFHSRSLLSLGFQFHDATDKSASKLLTTPTRNKDLDAVQLHRAHHEVGRYLALEYISHIIGLAEAPIPHVQGGTTTGHAFNNESNILTVALMRGGEPMAFGVSEVMPKASFVHAKKPGDIDQALLATAGTIILVDSVINSGASVIEFLEYIVPCARANDGVVSKDELKAGPKVVIVTGVIQSEAIKVLEDSCRGLLARERQTLGLGAGEQVGRFSLVTLRKSEKKYKGKGGTDTGNRLLGQSMQMMLNEVRC